MGGQSWVDCEQGDLSGKFSKLNKDTGAANTVLMANSTADTNKNLNVFTKVEGEEGAFSRALVIHAPAENGLETWFCAALGTSCHATPKDPKKPTSAANPIEEDGFDADCSIEKTSLLYIWEGKPGGKKYIMYAGEKTRLVPGRETRLPGIYNNLFERSSGP